MNERVAVFLEDVVRGRVSSTLNERLRAAELILSYDKRPTDVKSDGLSYDVKRDGDNVLGLNETHLQLLLKVGQIKKETHLQRLLRCVDDYECSGPVFSKGTVVEVVSASWQYPRIGEVVKSLHLDYPNSHHLVRLCNDNVDYFVFPTHLLEVCTWKY